MAEKIKLQPLDGKRFLVAGKTYTKGDYTVVYSDVQNGDGGIPDNAREILVSLKEKSDNSFVFKNVNYTSFVDENGDAYDSFEALSKALADLIAKDSIAQGPQGIPGPVGPAGLTWKGEWDADTAYDVDDAVGFGGASYFRIVAGTTATAPNADTTNWALLAARGANGRSAYQIWLDAGNEGTEQDFLDSLVGPSANAPYKVYKAFLEFVDSTTIIPTVFENTIGNGSGDGINDISWSYDASSRPTATMTNAPFTNGKTIPKPTVYGSGSSACTLEGLRINSSTIRYYSNSISDGTNTVLFVPYVFIEIQVYN